MIAPIIKPSCLKQGDYVYLTTPAFQATRHRIESSKRRLDALGLKVIVPTTLTSEDGYFAGTIEEKVHELHQAFANPEVKAIIAVRGGFGSARLLPYLDYDLIKNNPKIVLGYSDITALLLGLYTKTGLITFNGPGSSSELPEFTFKYYRDLLFENKLLTFKNETKIRNDIISTEFHTRTICSGIAEGRLLGGNLTVLGSLIGSSYLPENWHNTILFIEDTNEDPYRLDRILLQMKLAGILEQLSGIVLGSFTHCSPKIHRSFSLEKILENIFVTLGIPCFSGAMIGHQPQQFTLPIGANVLIDADKGEIRMLELALKGA